MAVSGRYQGASTTPAAGAHWLDLRVDVDAVSPTAPVTNRVSADLYAQSGPSGSESRRYLESWVVDAPVVHRNGAAISIEGELRSSAPAPRRLRLQLDDSLGDPPAGALVELHGTSPVATTTFQCSRQGDAFRDLKLEVDVCARVSAGRTLPRYDRAGRRLDLVACGADAGIAIQFAPAASPIDDSVPEFARWSHAELHEAMVDHFSQASGTWPSWNLWALVASRADDPDLAGIMFETEGHQGAGLGPERRGLAIFREHPLFQHLSDSEPQNDAEREAQRSFLHTWVHEIGHAFHLPHPWERNEAGASTWMSYPQTYDLLHGQGRFWQGFDFQFDDDELVHLRHGERNRVIMGGDPWAFASPGLSWDAGDDPAKRTGIAVELTLSSRQSFEFLEPVRIELRLRNLAPGAATLDGRLQPEDGLVAIDIQRPDGSISRYQRLACRLSTPKPLTLQPPRRSDGADRYSESVMISYGSRGFEIDQPGEYRVRAVYQGTGGPPVVSNLHRLRVEPPRYPEEEVLAQDFFARDVGLQIYFGMSYAESLERARGVIRELVERWPGTIRSAKLQAALASAEAGAFHQVREGVVHRVHAPQPDRALQLTRAALQIYDLSRDPAVNIEHANLAELHLSSLARVAWRWRVRRERSALRERLRERGVRAAVLEELGTP